MARGQAFEIAASDRIFAQLEREIAAAPGKSHKTALRVLRRAMQRGKSAASKSIREDVALPKKSVDERITARVISTRAVVGTLQVRDRRVQLVEFMTKKQIATAWRRQNARSRRSRGVSIKVSKKAGRKLFPGTFVNVGRKSGRWHVMQREGPDQYPAYIKYGPNLAAGYAKRLGKFAADQADWMNRELSRLILNHVDLK